MLLTDINALLDVKGYAFDETDLSAIQDSLTRSEAEFEEVAKLKEDLEARLQETSARYARLKSTIADFKTALRRNPIRVLIPEILSYIFLEYCGIHSAHLPTSLFSDDLSSTFANIARRRNVLLSVCRRWRSITLSTPRLWAAVDLSGPYVNRYKRIWSFSDRISPYLPPDQDTIEKHWQRVDEAVQRAGSVPLSIVQGFAGPRFLQDVTLCDAELSTMLQRLVEVLPRAEDVNLRLDLLTPTALPALSDDPKCWPLTPMPHLKIVHIASYTATPNMSQWLRHFLRQVPPEQLVDVELSCGGADGVFMENISCMTHVKRLSLSSCSLAFMSLTSTPLLEHLTLSHILLSGGPPPSPVCLSSLTSLTLKDIPSGIEEALSCLTLPSLQHLDIRINSREAYSFPSLSSFFERSQCHLQSLDIYDHSLITPAALLNVFRLQEHSLTSISLLQGSSREIDRSILDFLIGTPTQTPLPLLRRLELRVSPKQVPRLSRLLQHRFSMVTPSSSQSTRLEFCRICVQSRTSLPDGSIQKHRDVIQPYKDAGLDVAMEHSLNYH